MYKCCFVVRLLNPNFMSQAFDEQKILMKKLKPSVQYVLHERKYLFSLNKLPVPVYTINCFIESSYDVTMYIIVKKSPNKIFW